MCFWHGLLELSFHPPWLFIKPAFIYTAVQFVLGQGIGLYLSVLCTKRRFLCCKNSVYYCYFLLWGELTHLFCAASEISWGWGTDLAMFLLFLLLCTEQHIENAIPMPRSDGKMLILGESTTHLSWAVLKGSFVWKRLNTNWVGPLTPQKEGSLSSVHSTSWCLWVITWVPKTHSQILPTWPLI